MCQVRNIDPSNMANMDCEEMRRLLLASLATCGTRMESGSLWLVLAVPWEDDTRDSHLTRVVDTKSERLLRD